MHVQRSLAYGFYHAVVVVEQLSDDPWLDRTYHDNTDACDLSEFMVVTNTVSGCWDVVTLFFYENKHGIDVDVCIHKTLTISYFQF